MRNKRKSKFIWFIALLAVILFAVYHFINVVPDKDLSPNLQVKAILNDGGCMSCHTANPELPFYANMPMAKGLITKDIETGYKEFDMTSILNDLENGKLNQSDFEKIVNVTAIKKTMPLAKYYLVHWGSSITSDKKEIIENWAKEQRSSYPEYTTEYANEPICPIPDKIVTDPAKVALGQALYHDNRLSTDNTLSCASCHGLKTGGVDNKAFSEGVRSQFGGISAPTVYNAYFNFVQFWDGRAADLAAQAAGPPLNPIEMGCASFDEIIVKLNEDKEFTELFTASYPQGYSEATICNAIAEFEKTLITPNCRFDKYLKGDKAAISETELQGYELFKKYDCATCHCGVNVGGQSYDLMGIRNDYFADRANTRKDRTLNGDDTGRFKQTGVERDRYRQKVPGLRNVELTKPWFHDGTQETLADAVKGMDKYELNYNISDNDVNKIVDFLKTLTGEYNGKTLTNSNYK